MRVLQHIVFFQFDEKQDDAVVKCMELASKFPQKIPGIITASFGKAETKLYDVMLCLYILF